MISSIRICTYRAERSSDVLMCFEMMSDAIAPNALRLTVIASAPAALIGTLNLGGELTRADSTGIWQLELLARAGLDAPSDAPRLVLGLIFFVPLLAVAAGTSRLTAEAFARLRRHPVDRGWFYHAWLFALLAPATLPLPDTALAMAFGLVFGCYAFGGTGRYVASPALLGMLFTGLAYPDLLAPDAWVPGTTLPTTWAALAGHPVEATSDAWWPVFLGQQVGALGTTSALACLIGGGYLAARGIVPWRVAAGALLGLAVASALGGSLAGHWHLALGAFAFALAFLAPDPSLRPTTSAGSYLYGALFGALTVTLRSANPEHPEGTLQALLLAMLCVPMLDWLARAARRKREPVPSDG
jgi:Na+-transporting NADH:ubiquinone oxidoreductase subunit B